MKTQKLILLLALTFLNAGSYATVRTVNNNNPSPGQFSTFAAAHTAAVAGDTLYISGSSTSYGNGGISKQLTIIGTGHTPDKQNPLVSTFGDLSVTASGGTGSKFVGLNLTSTMFLQFNVSYEHCKFNALINLNLPGLNITFNKCVFAFAGNALNNQTGTSNVSFNNCIFNSTLSSVGGLIGGSATNCLFLGNATATAASNLSGFSFTNNIFYGTSPQVTGTSITMTKNLSFNCPNNNFNGTTLSGNIVNSNPLFITYVPTGFHSTDNYLLQSGSPGHNYGTDGKDIGLYGGAEGVNFHMGGEPSIPQIRLMNVTPTTVPSGGTISVNIISTVKL